MSVKRFTSDGPSPRLIIPAATACLATEPFGRTLLCTVTFGILSGVAGMYVSDYTDVASGMSITQTAAAL